MRVEDWAGPVAGPTYLEANLQIPKIDVASLAARNQVIALRKGLGRHVFPLAQFVDGRPVSGISDVRACAGKASKARVVVAHMSVTSSRRSHPRRIAQRRHGRGSPASRPPFLLGEAVRVPSTRPSRREIPLKRWLNDPARRGQDRQPLLTVQRTRDSKTRSRQAALPVRFSAAGEPTFHPGPCMLMPSPYWRRGGAKPTTTSSLAIDGVIRATPRA